MKGANDGPAGAAAWLTTQQKDELSFARRHSHESRSDGEVRNSFARYLQACATEPIFVTRNGRVTAVIEHIEDVDIEDFLLERSARFRRMLRAVRREKGSMTLAAYRKSRRL